MVHLRSPGTMHRGFSADPEMAYFVDALSVFKGAGYTFVEHPGTPLSVLGTLAAAAAHPLLLRDPQALVDANLRDPSTFMTLVHALLLAGGAAAIVVLSRLTALRGPADALLAVAVPASFFAAFPQSFVTLVYWSHNSFALAGGTLVLAGLFFALRGPEPSGRALAGLGLCAGALAAVQLYFAAWTIGLALACALAAWPRGARTALVSVLQVVVGAAAGFVAATVPVLPRFPGFLRFVVRLLGHQGLYGTGGAGVTTAPLWLDNVRALAARAPVLFVAVPLLAAAIGAAALAPAARRAHSRLLAAALGALLTWLLLLAAVGKHPSVFYLPALAAPLPLLLAAAFALWAHRARAARALCLGVAVAALVGAAVNGGRALRAQRDRVAFRVGLDAAVGAYLAQHGAAALPDGRVGFVLWGAGMGEAHCYPLWVGASYASPALQADVARACPGQGIAWPRGTVVPAEASGRGVFIALDGAAAALPNAAAIGPADEVRSVGPTGARVAFHRVDVSAGRLETRP